MAWEAPANYALNVGGCLPGEDRDTGVFTINIDLMTPETETTTHYFWTNSRTFAVEDTDLSEHLRSTASRAFDQDVEVIEAQHNRLPTGDIRGMRLATCREDAPAMRARSIVEKLYREEQSLSEAAE